MQKINSFLNRIKDLIEKYNYVFLFLIFIIFVLSRILFLDKRPCGVHVDEIAQALDAKYISEYGMDRHLDRMPVYFKNYGGGMNALYTYILAVLLKFLPYSVFTMRLPAVLCGCLCFIYTYRLSAEIFSRKAYGLLGAILMTIMPYYFASERWSLESNLFLSIVTVAMYYFVCAVKKNRIKDYILAGIWLGVTLYTYAVSYAVLILFLLITFFYLICKKNLDITKWIIMGIPLLLLALPLILFQLVNMNIIPEFSILGSDYHKLGFYRASELSFANIFTNIPLLKFILFGNDGLKYNSFPMIQYGTVYIFMVPIIIIGIVLYIADIFTNKSDAINGITIIFSFFLSSIITFLLIESPCINKVNEIYMTFVIFAIYFIDKIESKWRFTIPVFLLISGVFFVSYTKFYFLDQKDKYGYLELFHPTIPMDIIKYSEENYDTNNDKTIYFEEQYEDLGKEEMMLHAIANIPPAEFDENRTDYGKYQLHFPENFDENENAIYILGVNWNHITGYLQSIGYSVDNSFENYSIIYK